MTGQRYQADFGSQADQMALSAASNPIHNGGFRVWQRGTSFASAASGAYTADRWIYLNITAAVHTIQRSADVPTVAALVPLASYSMHLDVTTADAAIAAGDICAISQRIEGYAWAPFAQKQLTVGFWVKDTITGSHAVSLINAGADRSCVMEYTVSVADTWEYKTLTFPASPSTGTWDYTTGIGAYLSFTLAAGSVYQTTAGAWQSTTDFYGTAATVNSLSSNANNFKLWGVTLGLGTTVAPFWPRSYGEELALCQRYYEQIGEGVTNSLFGMGAALSATTGYGLLAHAPKRAIPTVAVNAATNFAITTNAGGSFLECSAVTFSAGTTVGTTWLSTHASGTVAGDAITLRAHNTDNAVITVSADL